MMKKPLIAVVGMGLIVLSQFALSSNEESLQQRCDEQAAEDKVEQAGYEDYIRDCIRYYQDSEPQSEDNSSVREEESEKAPSAQN